MPQSQLIRSINALAVSTALLVSPTVSAAIDGVLTVNGFEVPTHWATNYDRKYNSNKEICLPDIQSNYLLEQLVSLMLPVQETERLGLALSNEDVEGLNDRLAKAREFPDDIDPSFNAKGEVEFLRSRRIKHLNLLTPDVSDEEIRVEYQRRIDAKDPELVNRQLVRVNHMPFDKQAQAVEVYELATQGKDYFDTANRHLESGGSSLEIQLKTAKTWRRIRHPRPPVEVQPEFSINDASMFTDGHYWHVYVVVDVKTIPVVGLDQKLPGQSSMMKEIRWNMLDRAREMKLRMLREQADVELNGKTVPLPDFAELFSVTTRQDGFKETFCNNF